jgi:hypothetical protein
MSPAEQKIVKYITDHAGCSKAAIVRHMENAGPVSRITTLNYIGNLEAEKIIICRLEKPNSQIYRVYINEDSKVASLLGELEEFKEAYFILLEKSKEKMSTKDYSADAKALGIEETDPMKWQLPDIQRHLNYEQNMVEHIIKEFVNKSSTQERRLSDLQKRFALAYEEYRSLGNPTPKSDSNKKQISSDAKFELMKIKSEIKDEIL